MLVFYIDGCSLGNPGPRGIGVVVYKQGRKIREISKYTGEGTNNEAEYLALIEAIDTAIGMNEKNIVVRSDSELLIKQLLGEYKVKARNLKHLRARLEILCRNMKIRYEWVGRERNKRADYLAKKGAELGNREGL